MSQLYRMLDQAGASKAAIPCTRDEAKRWNTPEHGFGVFVTVNSFNGPRRKENLTAINAWAIDMDEGTKAEQHAKLHASPLIPSCIVETKRGYQAYWLAADGKAQHWNAIVLERLVPHFGSDANARDLCRILRTPGFLHLKDPTDPFLVRRVWTLNVRYTERQVADAFRWVPDRKAHQSALQEAQRAANAEARDLARRAAIASGMVPTETLWEAIYALDSRETLARLSGTHWVGGESYTFQRTAKGNWNIFVDKKSSSCFIDAGGHIGSMQGFGPTPAQWLRYWNHPWKEIINALKAVHPHLVDIDEAGRKAGRS